MEPTRICAANIFLLFLVPWNNIEAVLNHVNIFVAILPLLQQVLSQHVCLITGCFDVKKEIKNIKKINVSFRYA